MVAVLGVDAVPCRCRGRVANVRARVRRPYKTPLAVGGGRGKWPCSPLPPEDDYL
jgi:hypothetical protein